ncbi:MAG: MaoC family dehydratase [Oscillospiraceae bacterium]|nr:MaoC family dehydratase [Oscillospiraceae bacterium]
MNSYKFSDLSVGMSESFTVTITEEMMDKFIEITGDVSPIHVSREYAVAHGFANRVCHGMLFGSMFSTMAGVYLPGEHCLLHSVETKFSLPVFPGDVLTVTGKISEINDTFKTVNVKGTITNQNGKKVCKANIQLGVRE